MSVGLMSTIFETEFFDLPYKKDGEDRTAKASTCKLLLLAIADHANDYGESSYPGYKRLAKKTALSKQGIADTLDALEQNGILKISERESKLHTNNYTIVLSAFPRLGVQEPVIVGESSHLTTPGQATLQTFVKPLDSNHQLTVNKPSSANAPVILTPEEKEQAGQKVKKIIELQAGGEKHWTGREKIRPDLLVYADWYNSATGQVMTKRVQSAWWKAMSEWKEEGLETKHLQEALDARKKYRTVASPLELTSDAAAIKALGNARTTAAPAVTYDENGIPESY